MWYLANNMCTCVNRYTYGYTVAGRKETMKDKILTVKEGLQTGNEHELYGRI